MSSNNTLVYAITADMITGKAQELSLEILIPSIIYTFILLFFGLPGNLIILYVYYFCWKKGNAKYFVFTLASFDTINCLVSFPLEIVIMFMSLNFDVPAMCKLFRYTTFWMNGASALVLLSIAVDRYLKFCKPFTYIVTTSKAIKLCIGAFLLACVCNFPAVFVYGTNTFHIPNPYNITAEIKTCLIDDDLVGTKYDLIFYFWIFAWFVGISMSITILYIFIGLKLLNSDKIPTSVYKKGESTKGHANGAISTISSNGSTHKQSKRGSQPAELTGSRKFCKNEPKLGKSTFTLFLVTVVYYVSFMPYLTIVVWRTIDPDQYYTLGVGSKMAYHLFLRSYMLSTAVNPLIYSFCSDQFRKHVSAIFSKICCRT